MECIHFIGIGGVGMNGLAQLAVFCGYAVTGSDRAYDPDASPFQSLELLGITIHPQNGSGIDGHTRKVVYSTAIEPDNPDLLRAMELGLPLLHRAEFLKILVGDAELIAIAGTAGKTTTAGLLGWIFHCLDKDPTVYAGAAVLNWKRFPDLGNVRKGSASLWIIEADESDKSLLVFHPSHSIITNIAKDHYELDELHDIFNRFRNQTSGVVVEGSCPQYIAGKPDRFLFHGLEFQVPIIGRHNLENASCAVRLSAELGLDLERVRDAVSSFQGIERRLEIIGQMAGITVIDDYAHNPVKIHAALSAVGDIYEQVHAFWRPHGFTPLSQGMDELVETFARHCKLHRGSIFILPVYYAGGTVERKVTSRDLVTRLNSVNVPAVYVPDYNTLMRELEGCAHVGDAILGMGARDPSLSRFAKRLVSEWMRS